MLSRRTLLRLSSIGAIGACAPRVVSAQRPASPAAQAADVPAAIASLKSLKDQARPFTVDEQRARIDKAKKLMAESKIDAIMLTGGTSLIYFSGIRWGTSERLFGLIVPVKGEPFIVCPGFEEDRARELLAGGPLGPNVEVRTWQEDQSPGARVAEGLKDRGIAAGRFGIEETTQYRYSETVALAAPALKLVSATPVTAGCRAVKTPHEIGLMRLASKATLQCYAAVFRSLQPGMTQTQASALVQAAYGRLGFSGYASIQVGEYTALPHGSRTPQTIKEGTIVMIDDGCTVEGFQSDLTRTFVLSKATDKMKKVYEIVRRAQDAALAAAKPGAPCEAVDAAARKVIVDAGYGPDYKYFSHRLGHGLGMDMHEWPYLVRGNKQPLQAGNATSDEPGIYIPGEFGVRCEDDMVITENGAELLTPPSPSLEDPFGNIGT